MFCATWANAAGNLKGKVRRMPQVQLPSYTKVQWAEIVKNVKPRADDPNAKPIIQGPNAGKRFMKQNLITAQVVNGMNATIGQFPHHTLLNMDATSLCGGSLVLTNWVLTAAHCVHGVTSISVTVGTVDSDEPFPDGAVNLVSREKYVHENYNDSTLNNDVALIKLPSNVVLTDNIQLIKLVTLYDATTTFVDVLATISGFGRTGDGEQPSRFMLTADLTVLSNERCLSFYGDEVILSSNLCTSNETSKSVCPGDSGGPLVYKDSSDAWVQIGVASFVPGAGCLKGPAGFARVSSFLGWMSTTIGQDMSGTTTMTTTAPGQTTSAAGQTTAAAGQTTAAAGQTTSAAGQTTAASIISSTASTSKSPKPINCAKLDFSKLHGCCDTKRSDIITISKADKSCKNVNAKVFNNYNMNKRQNSKNKNSADFSDSKVQKALNKDALSANGQINVTTLAESLTASNQQNAEWKTRISQGLSQCIKFAQSNPVGNFTNGKSSCPGAGLVVLQCTVMKSIAACPVASRVTDKSCAKKWDAFDYCKNYIFA